MTSSHTAHRETTGALTPETQAKSWFIQAQSGDMSQADKAAFARWKLENPDNARAYEAYEEMWEKSTGLMQAASERDDMQALFAEARTPAAKPPFIKRASIFMAAAASIAIMAAGAIFWPSSPAIQQVYNTGIGEQKKIELADSSTVMLDTNTHLAVTYSGQKRHITLTEGQARFTVTADKERPFIVAAGNDEITVLGTVFDVRSQEGQVKVTLLSGKVRVGEEENLILKPGETVSYAPGEAPSSPTKVDINGANAWAMGRLVLNDVPLADAIAEFNRYLSRKITLANVPADNSYQLRGTFNVNDPDGFVMAVTQLFPLKAEESENQIMLGPEE